MRPRNVVKGPLFRQDFHACPTCDLIRATPVLVAVDVEAISKPARRPIFADVRLSVDLDERPEFEHRRAGNDISPTAEVRAERPNAWRLIRLTDHRVEAGHVGFDIHIGLSSRRFMMGRRSTRNSRWS
jgi:hypothetical protein